MKKIYLLGFIFITKIGMSQTLAPVHPDLNYSGPDNISHSIEFGIQNTGSTTLAVLVKRVSQTMTPGHETYFCWFECYDPSVYLSPVPITLAPGETTDNFHGWVTPASISGQDVVTYAFYDEGGNSDTLLLTLNYDFIHDGISEFSRSKNSLNIFINENKTATINYVFESTVNSKIQISNMLGKVVKEVMINNKSSNLRLPLGELTSGVYFCNLVTDGKFVAAKKFFITE